MVIVPVIFLWFMFRTYLFRNSQNIINRSFLKTLEKVGPDKSWRAVSKFLEHLGHWIYIFQKTWNTKNPRNFKTSILWNFETKEPRKQTLLKVQKPGNQQPKNTRNHETNKLRNQETKKPRTPLPLNIPTPTLSKSWVIVALVIKSDGGHRFTISATYISDFQPHTPTHPALWSEILRNSGNESGFEGCVGEDHFYYKSE